MAKDQEAPKETLKKDIDDKIPFQSITQAFNSLSTEQLQVIGEEATLPEVIRFLKECELGAVVNQYEHYIVDFAKRYGLVSEDLNISTKGRLLLENYPRWVLLILLFSEDVFRWLKADLDFVRLAEDGNVYLKVENDDNANHARFLISLGVVDSNYKVCDEYIKDYLKRRVDGKVRPVIPEAISNVGQPAPTNSYTINVQNLQIAYGEQKNITSIGDNSPIASSDGENSPINLQR